MVDDPSPSTLNCLPSSEMLTSAESSVPANVVLQEAPQNHRLGMERGYSLSPMYSLVLEYNREQGSNLSMATEVSWILQWPNLKSKDIIIKHDAMDPDTMICLVDSCFERILQAVTELQTFLDRMAELIQECLRVFRIDPQEAMITALQGCESRSQLELVYGILLKRLLVTQQMVTKYEAQYQCHKTTLLPISMIPELHEELDHIGGIDSHMRFMLQKFPHHQEQLSAGALTAVTQGQPWSIVHPTQVFSMEGGLPPSDFSQPIATNISAGKKRVEWVDTAPWDDKSSSLERGRDFEEGAELSFRFQTPFQTNANFFDTSESTPPTSFFSTPGATSAPNMNSAQDVTVGMATPSQTLFGDNVKDHGVAPIQSVNTTVSSRCNIDNAAQVSNTFDSPPNTNNPPLGKREPSQANGPPDARGRRPPNGNGGPPGGGGGRGVGGGGGHGGGGHFPNHPFHNNHNYSPSSGNPFPGGGGGSPGGGGGGGGSGPPYPGNQFDPPAPYGNMPATMKTELKVEQLPEWDGNHWTAIEYFWQVQQLMYLGGCIPEALGYWLWFRLKDGLPVKKWFVTLPVAHQTYMCSHYLKFLKGLKDAYLGHCWQLKMNNYYNSQSFRERNHEHESPSDFIIRRIIYTRMLLSVKAGGPLEVFYIMRKAPISWGPILLISSIKDSSELYS